MSAFVTCRAKIPALGWIIRYVRECTIWTCVPSFIHLFIFLVDLIIGGEIREKEISSDTTTISTKGYPFHSINIKTHDRLFHCMYEFLKQLMTKDTLKLTACFYFSYSCQWEATTPTT